MESFRWIVVLLLLALQFTPRSYAEEAAQTESLQVKPNRCIALRQGQYCYQNVEFYWTVVNENNYCLYERSSETALVCWQGRKLRRYEYEFKALNEQTFYLKDETENTVISEVIVDVAWVYKSGKKVSTGWRLF